MVAVGSGGAVVPQAMIKIEMRATNVGAQRDHLGFLRVVVFTKSSSLIYGFGISG